MDEMKRNLLVNSLLIAFSMVIAISAQEKQKNEMHKQVKVMVNGKVVTDTDSIRWISHDDHSFSMCNDSLVEEIVIMKIDGKPEGSPMKKIYFTNSAKGMGKNEMVHKMVNEKGDTMVVKTITFDSGKHNLLPPPPPPPLPGIKHFGMGKSALEALLNEPGYEVIEYERTEKKGVEIIEIKRKKIE